MRRQIVVVVVFWFAVASVCPAEFLVNTITADRQRLPGVAMDADGNFVVAWHSDAPSSKVHGQRFDVDGHPLGSEFWISTNTSVGYVPPDVAMDAAGNFVVTWNSSDGSEEGVSARCYSANGVPLTGEFRVNSYTASRQLSPSVALNDAGSFVVTWQSARSDLDPLGAWHVCGQAYSAPGARVGTEFVVTQVPYGLWPDVAMDDSGNFTVAYERIGNNNHPPKGWYVQTRRYDANANPKGDAVQHTDDLGHGIGPHIAMDGSGNSVIAWPDDPDEWRMYDIYARRFDSTGDPVGDAFRVNTTLDGAQHGESVAMNDDGQALIAWMSRDAELDDRDIFGRLYSGDGVPLGGEFRLNTYTDGDLRYPAAAISDNGRFVVVWQSGVPGGDDWWIFAEIGTIEMLPGDLNSDGFVGQDDLDIVLGAWGASPPLDPRADPSGDGLVGQADLDIVLADWGGVGGPVINGHIPEPAALSLLGLSGLAFLRRRRR